MTSNAQRQPPATAAAAADDFAAEMEAQAQAQLDAVYASVHGRPRQAAAAAAGDLRRQTETYDAVYFDSDEDELGADDVDDDDADHNGAPQSTVFSQADDATAGTEASRAKRQKPTRVKLTDDELLYDPAMDDDDERWVREQRQMHLPPDLKMQANGGNTARGAAQAHNYTHGMQRLPDSDAVLNCPACMTTLCLDCQRHERYAHQYRAMFTMNVTVNKSQIFEFKEPSTKLSKRERKKQAAAAKRRAAKRRERMQDGDYATNGFDDDGEDDEDDDAEEDSGEAGQKDAGGPEPTPASASTAPEDQFNPCYCTECGTLVAMFDIDEVFHFFNVIDSDA